MDYRHRLYQHYVTTHLASIREISMEAFEKQRTAFRSYFGRHLPLDKKAKILDAGCGYGCFLYHLQREGYENAVGVDVSPEQVALAQKLGVKNAECGDLMGYLEKNAEQFDCITAMDVVEHFKKEEILPLLDAIYSALKAGGIFIMQSPNAEGPFGGRYRYWDASHEIAFTSSSVKQVLSAAQFQDIHVFGCEPVVHGMRSGGRYLLWKGIRLLLLLYLAAETGSFQGYILTQNLIAVARKAEGTKTKSAAR